MTSTGDTGPFSLIGGEPTTTKPARLPFQAPRRISGDRPASNQPIGRIGGDKKQAAPKDAVHVATAIHHNELRLDAFDDELIKKGGNLGIGYPGLPSQTEMDLK